MIFIITILRNNEGYFFGPAIYARSYIKYISEGKKRKKKPLEKTENTSENDAVRKRPPRCGTVVAMTAVCARTRGRVFACGCVGVAVVVCGRVWWWWSGMGLKGLHQNDILKGRQCSIVMTSGHHYSSLGQWRAYTYRWMMADQN